MLMDKKREIEQRTVQSSQRSVGLLYESERVGQATAEELARQKEQLKATESRLDDINATLKQSERHLTGIKSVFGGLRNYFSGAKPVTNTAGASGTPSGATPSGSGGLASSGGMSDADSARLDSHRNANHPGLRVRGVADDPTSSSSDVDAILDRNLDEMSLGLSRLKGMANDLNAELSEHNDLLDRLDHKTSSTHFRVEKQNKEMNKILKK